MVSRESVKPYKSTPPHLETFNLSMVDQISATIHVSSLLFYNPTTETNNTPLDITLLKLALSKTLVHYYPLAGRLKDESTIICNDEGVPFIVADVNCTLSAVVGSSQTTLDLSTKFQFCPPLDILSTGEQHISKLAHLAFQVNVFSCGGVVIGCYMLHKILDGTSFGLFLKHWSVLTRTNDCHDLIHPDFNSTVIVFPPYHHPQPQKQEKQSYLTTYDGLKKVIIKGFIFSDAALTKLKTMSASKHVPNPTRFESLVGFIWEQCLAAESLVSKHTENHVLYFQGYRKGSYFASSWCRNGLSEADFGFGKPKFIVFPVMNGEIIPFRNWISLSDYNHPDGTIGTVAWIFLEEKEMQILESNQQFLAFTSLCH